MIRNSVITHKTPIESVSADVTIRPEPISADIVTVRPQTVSSSKNSSVDPSAELSISLGTKTQEYLVSFSIQAQGFILSN